MKFTIDTDTDSYEDAMRAIQAAYGRTGDPIRMTLRPLPRPLPPYADAAATPR
ncbi:hypothetical protein ACIA78_32845 [Streptomyces xanthochromogenes]|uniref:hypothetical protein n=1 Tax=Streptomyces xanthochromogenes TaxID=67384 RepID=UPI0037B7E71E